MFGRYYPSRDVLGAGTHQVPFQMENNHVRNFECPRVNCPRCGKEFLSTELEECFEDCYEEVKRYASFCAAKEISGLELAKNDLNEYLALIDRNVENYIGRIEAAKSQTKKPAEEKGVSPGQSPDSPIRTAHVKGNRQEKTRVKDKQQLLNQSRVDRFSEAKSKMIHLVTQSGDHEINSISESTVEAIVGVSKEHNITGEELGIVIAELSIATWCPIWVRTQIKKLKCFIF